jgi:hypothetical protein
MLMILLYDTAARVRCPLRRVHFANPFASGLTVVRNGLPWGIATRVVRVRGQAVCDWWVWWPE